MLTMHKSIVINTGPIIALIAALNELTVFQKIYTKVIVPYEVSQEITAQSGFYDAKIFSKLIGSIRRKSPLRFNLFLLILWTREKLLLFKRQSMRRLKLYVLMKL